MAIPQARDLEAIRGRLVEWLAARLPAGAAPEIGAIEVPESSGFSSETLMLDAAWSEDGARTSRGLVVRTRPGGYPIFPEYDLALQYRCMELVARHSDVPVPPLYWYEEQEDVLGEPFYVMGRVEGQVPPDRPPFMTAGFLFEATPREQERLFRRSLETLAELHRLDWQEHGFAFLSRPGDGAPGLTQQLRYWKRYLEWARAGREQPVLDAAWDHLERERPDDSGRVGLNWGDSRIGNIMYRDFEPVAVFDWEMATLGPPEVDLAWFLFINRYLAAAARAEPLPGFPERKAAVELYEACAGRPVRDLEYFEIFAGFRYGVIWLRLVQRMADTGEVPEELVVPLETNNPDTQLLAEMLGLPPPGPSGSFGAALES